MKRNDVTIKKDDDYCKCKRPKVLIINDDLGRPVKYCDRCWTVIIAKEK